MTFPRAHAVWILAAIVAGLSLRGPREEADAAIAEPAAAPSTSADDAMVSGCAAVRTDGTCEVGATPLRVWVDAAPADTKLAVDGVDVDVHAMPVAGGTRARVAVSPNAHRLEVKRRGSILLRVALAPAPVPEPAMIEARRLRDDGKLDAAEARVLPLLGSNDAVVQARALALLARISMSRDDWIATDDRFARALAADDAAGLASDRVDDAAAWMFSLFSRSKIMEAHRELERAEASARVYPDGRARLAYYRGVFAGAVGHTRSALLVLRDGAKRAERLGLDWMRRSIREEMACNASLREGGREAYSDLVALYGAESESMGGCEKADLAQNIAYVALHDAATAREGAPWVDRALGLYRDACPSHDAPQWTAALRGKRAEAALARGEIAQAHAAMRDARAVVPHPEARVAIDWWMVEGGLAEAEHDDTRAEYKYREAARVAASIGARDMRRRAIERIAEIFVRRGARAKAVAALDEASTLADEQIAEIPLGAGRERFLRAREPGDARRIDLLVQLGRPDEALAHLRRASARALASLEREDRLDALAPEAAAAWEAAVGEYDRARDRIDREAGDDWRYSAATLAERTRARAAKSVEAREALEAALAHALGERRTRAPHLPQEEASPAPLLAIMSSPDGGLVFFAEGSRVEARRIGALDVASPSSLATEILTPFAPALRRASSLTVLAYGSARAIDVHALPFDGAPLIAQLPIVYSLGSSSARDAEPPRRALIVVDPTLDLTGARRAEAASVMTALARIGALDAKLVRGDDAQGDAIRAALAQIDLFHYAGHGVARGSDGAESALPLSEHGALAVSDVLALSHAPSLVFLDGCTTASDSGEAAAHGLGMAQAFVVAGARAVIGATRAIDDRTGPRLSDAFYTRLAEGDSPAQALRAAQRRLASEGAADWSAFRLLAAL